MDFTSLFNMQGMMFCILALGWYLRKSGMIDKSGKALLSSLVMNVTLPASIVKSFQMEFSADILKLTLEVIVISFLIQIFSNLLSRVLYPGWSEESKKVLQCGGLYDPDENLYVVGGTHLFYGGADEERAFKEGRDTSMYHRNLYRHGTSGIPVPASRICKPDGPDGRRGEHVLRDASDRVYSRGNPV